jgi:hypothetical protein
MKKLALLLFISVLHFSQAYGQRQFSIQKDYVSFSNKFYENNGLHLLGQWQNEFGKKNVGLKQIITSKDSIAIIEKLEIGGENSKLTHLIAKPEGGYVGIYFEKGCRYAAKGNFIFHLNNDFSIDKAPVKIHYFFRNIRDPIHSAYFIYKNTLVLATKKFVATYDIATRRVISRNDTLSSYDIVFPFDNQFVCVEKNKFHIFNVFCDVVGSQVIDFTPKSLFRTRSNNGFIGIGKHKIAVLNEKGVVVFDYNWQNLANDFDSLIAGRYISDTLFVYGKKGNHFKLAKMTNQFAILSSHLLGSSTFSGQPIKIEDVHLRGNKLFCLKSTMHGVEEQHYVEIFNLDQTRTHLNQDIGIGLASIDSLNSKPDESQLHCNFFGQYSLTNYSSDTLKSFYFKWKSSANTDCNGPQKAELIKCKIEPGGSQTFRYAVSDSFLTPEAGYTLCIHIVAPNGAVDTLSKNNSSCTNTTLPPVSIEENTLSNLKIPSFLKAGDQVYLDFEVESYQIIGLNGNIFEKTLNDQILVVPADLSNGIYILNIETKTKRYSQRFLIVN